MVAFPGRMLVAEDDPLAVRVLRRGLLRGWELVVCDAVEDAEYVLEHETVDAALFDLRLADGWTHGLVRWAVASRPGLPIAVQSGHIDERLRRDLVPAGVVVAEKPASRVELGSFLAQAGWRTLAGEDASWAVVAQWAERHGLSQREACVMVLAVRGQSNQDIGLALAIEAETVKQHLRSVFDKTGCRGRLAVAWALSREAADQGSATRVADPASPGLCAACRFGISAAARGVGLPLCTQGRLPRYPRLPVTECKGFVDETAPS